LYLYQRDKLALPRNLPSRSEVIGGDIQTDRQTGDLISLLSFLESKLIMTGGKVRGKESTWKTKD
jgi:hypothetical protein